MTSSLPPWWTENPFKAVYRSRSLNVYLNIVLLLAYLSVGGYEYQRGAWVMGTFYMALVVGAIALLVMALRHRKRVTRLYLDWEHEHNGV